MSQFAIDVFWSDDDGCFVADIPDLFPCAAFGETPEAALAEVLVAKEAWLESARALGYIPAELLEDPAQGPRPTA